MKSYEIISSWWLNHPCQVFCQIGSFPQGSGLRKNTFEKSYSGNKCLVFCIVSKLTSCLCLLRFACSVGGKNNKNIPTKWW